MLALLRELRVAAHVGQQMLHELERVLEPGQVASRAFLRAAFGDFQGQAVHVPAQRGEDGAHLMHAAADQPFEEADGLIPHSLGYLIAVDLGEVVDLTFRLLQTAPVPATADLRLVAALHGLLRRRLHKMMAIGPQQGCQLGEMGLGHQVEQVRHSLAYLPLGISRKKGEHRGRLRGQLVLPAEPCGELGGDGHLFRPWGRIGIGLQLGAEGTQVHLRESLYRFPRWRKASAPPSSRVMMWSRQSSTSPQLATRP